MSIDNPWRDRRVLAFGHRGSARLWPENTLYAFRRAVAAGAPALEMDLRLTADGEIIVCHDATVDRTTDGSGPVAGHTFAELQELDAAYRFVPGHGAEEEGPDGPFPLRGWLTADLRIPSLRAVLAEFPATLLTMEAKEGPPDARSLAADVAELLAEFGRSDDVIVSAFEDSYLREFRQVAPTVPTATSAGETAAFWSARDLPVVAPGTRPPVAFQVPITYQGVEVVSRAFVADAQAAGLAVHVWTVDDRDEMAWLLDLGVDGIMSDHVDRLLSTLRDRGVAWSDPRTETEENRPLP
ncbi:MAG TPA: glycerophosphodiester phosphodiesterase [Egibacteraceae bacterium]|nr:glycerophosphodiester phosphodiesterase [Egibacteraceae bacterium]